jgi:hypothetical protein
LNAVMNVMLVLAEVYGLVAFSLPFNISFVPR